MDTRIKVPAPVTEERFKFCALSGGSINQDRCRVLSRVPSKNDVCTKSQCLSPWRLCAACVREDGRSPSTVAKRGGRLCAFHEKKQEEVQSAPVSVPRPALKLVPEVSRPSSAKPELVAQTLELAPPLEGAIVPLKPVVEPGLKEFKAPDVPVVRESEDVVVIETAQEPHQTGLVEDIARPVLSGHLETDVPPRGVRLELEKGAMRYASEDDIREFASNISRVKGRQRIVLETVMQHGVEEGGKMLNLQPSSVLGYLGMVSRVMGIPKPNRFHPYDRMNAMRRAWEYRKVNPEACGDPEKVVLQRGEWQLLESFRVMSLSDRAQLLRIAEIFASKTK